MPLTTERREALQELVNIAFGSSMGELSDLLNAQIKLSVPVVCLVPDEILAVLEKLADEDEGRGQGMHQVHQIFWGDLAGQALFVLPTRYTWELLTILREASGFHPNLEGSKLEVESLQEVANIVVGACLSKLASLLDSRIFFDPPRVTLDRPDDLSTVFRQQEAQALLIQTHFQLNLRQVTGFLCVFLPPDGLATLLQRIDGFLASLA